MDAEEQDRQVGETVKWFKKRGIDLAFDQVNGAWVALMIPEGQRIGSAHAAHGDTKLQAADNARAVAEERPNPGTMEVSAEGDITIHVPTATAVADEATSEVTISGDAAGTAYDSGTGRDHATVIRDAERKAAEFGWQVAYARQPDDSYTWIVRDAANGDVLQSGTEDTWDDAKLASIMKLYPPSGEK